MRGGPHQYPEQVNNYNDLWDCIHEQWLAERQEYPAATTQNGSIWVPDKMR